MKNKVYPQEFCASRWFIYTLLKCSTHFTHRQYLQCILHTVLQDKIDRFSAKYKVQSSMKLLHTYFYVRVQF